MYKLKFVLVSVFSFLILGVFSTEAFAAVDLTLSPSTGTITDNTAIDININTNGDSSAGVAFRLSITGSIQYVNLSDNGDYCASNFSVTNNVSYLDIICLNSSSIAMNGTLGTVYFDATEASSTANLAVSSTGLDLGGLGTGTLGTGSYSTGTVPTNTITTNNTSNDLPETGILDNSLVLILLGVLVVLIAILIPEIIIVKSRKSFNSFEGKVDSK